MTIPRLSHITPNEHEKAEWARMAQAAYSEGRNSIGHRYSAAAATPKGEPMDAYRFDRLATHYRSWLIDGFEFVA